MLSFFMIQDNKVNKSDKIQQKVKIKDFYVGKNQSLAVMAGPCVIESEKAALQAAETLKKLFSDQKINFIYKSSFDKANRSALTSYRGPGLKTGLKILAKIKREFDLPIVTDIHIPEQAPIVAEVADILQIPAFLCRQTDLIAAAAKTKKAVNIKKGQFMAPLDMQHAIDKAAHFDNRQIILTDRGTFFGYNNLVSDMRSIFLMQSLGYPVCFDATHSVQLPGGQGHISGGQREFIGLLAKAAIAAGANLLFLEAHATPDKALSDAASQISFHELEKLLTQIKKLYTLINSF